ncbi:phage baseplate assembly protein V [Salmonella enterica]|nr:phage baseplate assembly protein V [Salmonella enterica]EIF6375146.1 phage baseplate assembly protein V [Salmonella enterica]
MDIVTLINRRIAAALNSIRRPFRAVLTRTRSDGNVMMTQLSGLEDENLPGIEVFQQFGLTSVPPAGTMAVVVPVGGRTSHSVVIATEHGQYRIRSLKPGEVSLYNEDGASVTLKKGQIIDVQCIEYNVSCRKYSVTASESARFETPEVIATKKLTARGLLTGSGGMTISGDNGSGVTATLSGDITHINGTVTSVAVTINGVKIGPHIHDTPHGPSGPARN